MDTERDIISDVPLTAQKKVKNAKENHNDKSISVRTKFNIGANSSSNHRTTTKKQKKQKLDVSL